MPCLLCIAALRWNHKFSSSVNSGHKCFSTVMKTGDQVECAEVTSSVGRFRLLKKMREGISLVGFHSLIDQKQKNCHHNKQQHFYPHGNGASLLCLFRLDVCQGNILGDIFGCEWFFHPEVTELQRPACSPFDWSAAASTVQREREFQIILRPTNVSTRTNSKHTVYSSSRNWHIKSGAQLLHVFLYFLFFLWWCGRGARALHAMWAFIIELKPQLRLNL